jgi:adenylate kinase family enzyme
MSDDRHIAMLLLGPTASGKTPLGEELQRRGLCGRRCVHFDFGANLRAADAGQAATGLTAEELGVIAQSLRTGALLEDEHFPIARKLLSAFIAARRVGRDDVVALNGLPRHVGQARDLDGILDVRLVVRLACSAETVMARIARDTGGDRAGRADDDLASVRRKLDIFAERTRALADHYAAAGASVVTLEVAPATTAADARDELARQVAEDAFTRS